MEVCRLLSEAALCHFAVALCHLDLSATLSPVDERNAHAHLHYLVVLQIVVGSAHGARCSCESYLGMQSDLAQIAFCNCHRIVCLQLPAADVACKSVVAQGMVEHVLVLDAHFGHAVG